ncbi:hypothetical protein KKB11_05670, partial [Candidatus Micrarchaeota archaeon]|nr:hypothetical protein [Candidatus Micrarchaeota archaeon]
MLGVIQNSAFPQPFTPELRGVVYETEKSSLLGDAYFTAQKINKFINLFHKFKGMIMSNKLKESC